MNNIININFILSSLMLVFAIKNDIKDNSIKNIIPFCGGLLGIVLSFFYPNNLLINIITCFLFFLFLFAIPRLVGITEFMGAGDIKIYMALILLMGYKVGVYTFIYSIFIGAIFLLILNFKRLKDIFQNVYSFFKIDKKITTKIIDSKKPNIFSPYIFIGVIVAYIQIYIYEYNWLFEMIVKNFK